MEVTRGDENSDLKQWGGGGGGIYQMVSGHGGRNMAAESDN